MPNSKLVTKLAKLLGSPSVRSAVVFGVGGIAFSLATLLFARYMPAGDFGRLALLLALVQVGVAVGPAGLDLLVNRQQLNPSRQISRVLVVTSLVGSALIVAVTWQLYDLPTWVLPPLGLAVAAAASSKVGAAFFQSKSQFNASLALVQVHNFILLAAVGVAMVWPQQALQPVLWCVAGGYCVTAVVGWLVARRRFGTSTHSAIGWRDGLNGVGIVFAVLVLAQTERVVIPLVLSFEDMALFGVLAAVVVAPFRMLQLAVGYTLLPRLRNAASVQETRRIIRAEVVLAAMFGLAGAVGVFFIGPLVIKIIVGDKYVVERALLLAAVGVGWVRLLQSIVVAIVNSLGDSTALQRLNVCAWIALGVAVGSAFLLGKYGLIGVIAGVGAGWLVLGSAGLAIAYSTLNRLRRLATDVE